MGKAPYGLMHSDVQRMLLCDMEQASKKLIGNEIVSHAAIHSARKKLKRARTALKLLRGAVDRLRYSRANGELRDAGRKLAHLRDRRVMLRITTKFLKHEKRPPCRAFLLELQRRARTKVVSEDNVKQSARAIDAVVARARRWHVVDARFDKLTKSAQRIYGKSRKALGAVRSNCCDRTLHELRKQTQHVGRAMKLFANNGASGLKKSIGRALVIAEWLGDDHDLVLMQQHIRALPSEARKECADLDSTINRRRKKLQKKALEQCARLYKHSRKDFGTLLTINQSCGRRPSP